MERCNNFNDLPGINVTKTCSINKFLEFQGIYREKGKKIKIYDSNHVIKKAGYRLEYLEMLKNLNIPLVNSPVKILEGSNINLQSYYIVSQYLHNHKDFDAFFYLNKDLEQAINILILLLETLKKCHQQDFFPGDLHYSNILVSLEGTPKLFDFDTSLFIKKDGLFVQDGSLKTIFYDNNITYLLRTYYNINEEQYLEYEEKYNQLQEIFAFFDKLYIISKIIDFFQYKRGDISKLDEGTFKIQSIKKLGLPSTLEKKLISILCEGEVLQSEDYFIDELTDLSESRLIRSHRYR